jgi:hypothetical protein
MSKRKPTLKELELNRLVAEAGATSYQSTKSETIEPKAAKALLRDALACDIAGLKVRSLTPFIFLAVEAMWQLEGYINATGTFKSLCTVYAYVFPAEVGKIVNKPALLQPTIESWSKTLTMEDLRALTAETSERLAEFYTPVAAPAQKKSSLKTSKIGRKP